MRLPSVIPACGDVASSFIHVVTAGIFVSAQCGLVPSLQRPEARCWECLILTAPRSVHFLRCNPLLRLSRVVCRRNRLISARMGLNLSCSGHGW